MEIYSPLPPHFSSLGLGLGLKLGLFNCHKNWNTTKTEISQNLKCHQFVLRKMDYHKQINFIQISMLKRIKCLQRCCIQLWPLTFRLTWVNWTSSVWCLNFSFHSLAVTYLGFLLQPEANMSLEELLFIQPRVYIGLFWHAQGIRRMQYVESITDSWCIKRKKNLVMKILNQSAN